MNAFEYKRVVYEYGLSLDALNHEGENGWELCDIEREGGARCFVIYKRKLNSVANQTKSITAHYVEKEREKLLDEVDEILNRLKNDEKCVFTWSEVREWVKNKRNAGAKN